MKIKIMNMTWAFKLELPEDFRDEICEELRHFDISHFEAGSYDSYRKDLNTSFYVREEHNIYFFKGFVDTQETYKLFINTFYNQLADNVKPKIICSLVSQPNKKLPKEFTTCLPEEFIKLDVNIKAPTDTKISSKIHKEKAISLSSVENSSLEALRPASCTRAQEDSLDLTASCTDIDQTGSSGQASGCSFLKCQQTLIPSDSQIATGVVRKETEQDPLDGYEKLRVTKPEDIILEAVDLKSSNIIQWKQPQQISKATQTLQTSEAPQSLKSVILKKATFPSTHKKTKQSNCQFLMQCMTSPTIIGGSALIIATLGVMASLVGFGVISNVPGLDLVLGTLVDVFKIPTKLIASEILGSVGVAVATGGSLGMYKSGLFFNENYFSTKERDNNNCLCFN